MLINRPHLARIGHNQLPAQPLQVSTDPRTMRSSFHHCQCSAVTSTQSAKGNSIVAKSTFLHHFAFALSAQNLCRRSPRSNPIVNSLRLFCSFIRPRAYPSAHAQALFAFSSNLVRLVYRLEVIHSLIPGCSAALARPSE